MSELGRLKHVDLRDVWKTEAQHFTPWLAREENLSVLASTLHMELELESQETNVGPFRADILCRNADGGSWVLIENQLERTDHTHLGQLLTYAAGLHAVTVCWIAESFTEEHRATSEIPHFSHRHSWAAVAFQPADPHPRGPAVASSCPGFMTTGSRRRRGENSYESIERNPPSRIRLESLKGGAL